jgi:hypothetical protein
VYVNVPPGWDCVPKWYQDNLTFSICIK